MIVSILLFTISACEPIEDPKDEETQYLIPSNIKSYFGSFKEGSWWVYRDTVSGDIDTFRCVKQYDETKVDCFYEIDDKKLFASNIYYRLDHNLPGTLRKYITFNVQTSCDIIEETTVTMTFEAGSSTVLYFKKDDFEEVVVIGYDSIISTFYSSFSLNNVSYSDVYYVENTKEGSYNNFNYIYCKDIGIIGFNTKNYFDDNWAAYYMLIDKNIVL